MSIELDLHNLTVVEAVKSIQKTIMGNPNCDSILAIHGYKHGCAIKQMLQNKFNIHNKRVRLTVPDMENDGRTWILLYKGVHYE